MKPENEKQSTNKLLKELNIDDQQALEITRDIQAGDELLGRYSESEIRPEVLLRIEQRINERLVHGRAKKRIGWVWRLTAAAAVIVLLMSATAIMTVNNADKSVIFDDEQILWEVTFSQEYAEYEIDDIALTEVLLFLEEIETETESENTIGNKIKRGNYV